MEPALVPFGPRPAAIPAAAGQPQPITASAAPPALFPVGNHARAGGVVWLYK